MANTTNFGWETPDDTDLVKDGAAAMRTLGNSIDASFVDLKGGTTGQVLAKASNTDLDYTWTNVDPLTILDAKGDLISATAADTPARLAVGTNGQYLQADSTTSTGLKWATVSVGGMTELATGSFSSTTTTISGLSGSYNDLMIYIYDIGNATGGDSLRMRVNGLSTSIYGTQIFTATSVGMTSASASFNLQYSSNTADSMILVRIPGYANTVTHKFINYMHGTGDANLDLAYGCGVCRTTNAITELSFFWDAGYTFNRGTYTIYGVK